MGLSKDAKPGSFRCAESTREEEPTSWARAAVELQVCAGPWTAPRAHSSVPRSPFPALQDEATSAFSPTSPLGPGVLLPAPLAVGPVHSLPQVCAWGFVYPLHVWLQVRSPHEGSACASTLSLGQNLPLPTGLTALLPLGSGLRGNKLGCRAV